jgi:hypothetical protein
MRWRRLGRIFDPCAYRLPAGCREFAQSPQALVLSDRVRIYFSTRSVDAANGKYRSHVAFVDMAKNLRDVIGVSEEAVIGLGATGCFDEHGIFPMNVVRRGDHVLGYTCGWSRRVSVSVETAIGLALSGDDGRTFVRIGNGPIMAASLHEPCLVGDPFVRWIGDRYHMWYIFGTGWEHYPEVTVPERTYKIGHAVSTDGRHWAREEGRQIVADVLGPEESQALPTVVEIDDRHHMFFCFRRSSDFRTNRERSYRIGHAVSEDLLSWRRDDEALPLAPKAGEWDSDMLCYPHAFQLDGGTYLLYNGNEFGRRGFGLAVLDR